MGDRARGADEGFWARGVGAKNIHQLTDEYDSTSNSRIECTVMSGRRPVGKGVDAVGVKVAQDAVMSPACGAAVDGRWP
jgi:hypothetical protein